ncbi:MAG: ABC transporter ATP-binding protein [Anaerolineaceae bacterium]|jgi:ATP-binding cassette subfamily B protein|nr:ABC transporter ATP-binding protein [Anaerolineaceae bacterium]
MGFFDGLDAEKYDRTYSDRDLVGRIIGYFKPQWKRLVLISFLTLAIAGAGSLMPVTVSRGVDLLEGLPTLWGVIAVAGAVMAIGLVMWLCNWALRRLITTAIAEVVAELSTQAYTASVEHDLSFYDEFSSGKIVSRITSDTRDFGELVSLITDVASMFIEALILAVILLVIEWKLSLYVFALIPIVTVLGILYRTIARKVTRQGMRAMANVNATIKETVSGISVAKNFRQEASIYDEFTAANDTSYKVNVKRGLALAIVFPTLNAMAMIATGVMVLAGGHSVIAGVVTLGAWYLFISSLDRFLFPIMNLTSFWSSIQNGLSAAERVFALIDTPTAVVQTAADAVPSLKGQIIFENVSFHYKESEQILSGFNLKIDAGENLAIVGHTGAGKTSIAKLIARFYEFQEGRILIDGHDIRSFNLEDYRRRLGVVSQVPFLFSGTVEENIRYARRDATDQEILSLARKIGDGEWLDTLPQGLATEVGERGTRLSMGQRQLVALMRVLVQHPAIFILDEATASIDPFTEWQIQQALDLILQQSTSILIAHRLSTVKSADRIIVMENGRIIEEGNHLGLLAQGGHYALLYNTYFRHQSLEYVEHAREMAAAAGEA